MWPPSQACCFVLRGFSAAASGGVTWPRRVRQADREDRCGACLGPFRIPPLAPVDSGRATSTRVIPEHGTAPAVRENTPAQGFEGCRGDGIMKTNSACVDHGGNPGLSGSRVCGGNWSAVVIPRARRRLRRQLWRDRSTERLVADPGREQRPPGLAREELISAGRTVSSVSCGAGRGPSVSSFAGPYRRSATMGSLSGVMVLPRGRRPDAPLSTAWPARTDSPVRESPTRLAMSSSDVQFPLCTMTTAASVPVLIDASRALGRVVDDVLASNRTPTRLLLNGLWFERRWRTLAEPIGLTLDSTGCRV